MMKFLIDFQVVRECYNITVNEILNNVIDI